MCAILGWMNKRKNIDHITFKNMLETMNNRGKDNTGIYQESNIMLGHKRLAIRDLEKGNQPMYFKDYIIVYNGEIYNSDEIKDTLLKKGYSFDTNCDTEVVLKGYHCFKEKILDKLEGIFAFSIYNKKTKKIFLARDRFGVKPLYYTKYKNNFIFASMIKPLLKSKVIKAVLTKKELANLLALGPSRKSGSGILKGIYELKPAHYLIYKKGKVKIKRYWQVKNKRCNDTFDEAREKVKTLLTDSIKRQMISDIPIATLLSGGLDSSIITAIVALNSKDKLTTYSIDYEEK